MQKNVIEHSKVDLSQKEKKNEKMEDFDFTKESVDMIRFIDQNEKRHLQDAQKYLKQN